LANSTLQDIEDAIKVIIASEVDYLTSAHIYTVPAEADLTGPLQNMKFKRFPSVMLALEGFDSSTDEDEREPGTFVWTEHYYWMVFIVAKSFRTASKQIRGDSTLKGAYDLIEDVTNALQNVVFINGMIPCQVSSAKMISKTPTLTIYRIDITCGQDRGKEVNAPC